MRLKLTRAADPSIQEFNVNIRLRGYTTFYTARRNYFSVLKCKKGQ